METTTIERYLQQVIESLKNLQRPQEEKCLLSQGIVEDVEKGFFTRDFGMEPWDWPQGVGLYGLYNRYLQSGEIQLLSYLTSWFDEHLAKPLPRLNINTMCPFLTLSFLSDQKPKYHQACEEAAAWLYEKQPRTPEGGFQHTTTKDAAKNLINENAGQIWIDTLFMSVLFLANWGVKTNNKKYQQEAVKEYLVMIKYLYEKKKGLFYHAWSFPERSNFGDVFWCRGNSWFIASVADFIPMMGDHLDEGVRNYILDTYRAQAEALGYLQAEDGLWHTVLDDPSSYTETSGSAAITYGILKGIRHGFLEKKFSKIADKAIIGVLSKIDESGVVRSVSAGTRVGNDRAHYKGIMLAPMAYGQSLVILALGESLNRTIVQVKGE